jgi:hypothetical protein
LFIGVPFIGRSHHRKIGRTGDVMTHAGWRHADLTLIQINLAFVGGFAAD